MTESLTANQALLKKLNEIVLSNLGNENFGVKELVKESGLSRYILTKRLYAITKKTINQFVCEIRLKKALEMLRNEEYTVAEVAYKTGFGSPAYFNRSFHRFFGYPPGEVKKRESIKPDTDITFDSTIKNIPVTQPWRSHIFTFRGVLILAISLGMVGFLLYKKNQKSSWTDDLASLGDRISIAVMPFRNMTNDTTWNIWQDGIQMKLISSLSNANNKELKIRQKEDINTLLKTNEFTKYASISPGIAGRISQKLDAGLFVYGSIMRAGLVIQVDAELISTKTQEVIKSFTTVGDFKEANVFQIIDTLSGKLINFLLISKLIKQYHIFQHDPPVPSSPESFRYCYYGDNALAKTAWPAAIDWYSKAVAADSNNFWAEIMLASAYGNNGEVEQSLLWVLKTYKKRNRMSLLDQLWASWAYAYNFESPLIQIQLLRQIQQTDDQLHSVPYLIGCAYNSLKQYDKAIPEFKKTLEIYKRWGSKPFWVYSYSYLGLAYHRTEMYKEEKRLYKKAEKDFPNDPELIYRQAVLALATGNTKNAYKYIEKFKSIRIGNLASEADVEASLASIYSEAHILDKAEAKFREALSLEPENPWRMSQFAWFLINNSRNLNEVPELMDKAMFKASNKLFYYDYLETKGWGLYKLGKKREALEILQKTWDEAPFKFYSIRSHLEEVSRAVEKQQ
jgi:AraC-like DNA-binding protein/tetratricopeptide (TPR) repeat protein